MLLELAHEKLGWPSPEEIRAPAGEGTRILVELARAKIGNAVSQHPDASGLTVGILARNPQALTTESPLAVIVEFEGKPSDETLRELHRLAWNFSHSPALITVEMDLLRAWTCCEHPDSKRPIEDYVVHELRKDNLSGNCGMDITQRATQVLHWVNLVSGQFFRVHSKRFRRDQRADRMLLGNLQCLRKKLHDEGLTNDDVCHDLLARIIFVQFLFDRKDARGRAALNEERLASLKESGILKREHPNLASILDDYDDTYRLFDWLNTKFNGDLFPSKGDTPAERMSGWRKEKEVVKVDHLRMLRDFVTGEIDMPSGQLCLWPQYAFDAIPLEFISSIYETFVTERASKNGIYYTPPYLVDFILDRVLPWDDVQWNLRILDPACGSGVFLVKAFQRLVHRWKKAHPNESIRAEVLRGLLEKGLFGVDRDRHAVRVASFSLYLAMCDEIDPKHYWTQVTFPPMRGHRLIDADFFDETHPGFRTVEDAGSYDLVIGNAPWGEKLLTDAARKWAEDAAHTWPLPNKGIGTLFLPKAAALTKPDGRVSMIQSASSLLFNQSGPARKFRSQFFNTFDVEEVVNLSALRFRVFQRKSKTSKSSVAPSCVVIFKPDLAADKMITYVSPKQCEDLGDEFNVVIDTDDVKTVSLREAKNNNEIWAAAMWGFARDMAFLRRLKTYRTISRPGSEYEVETREGVIFGDRKKRQSGLLRPIMKGCGFPEDSLMYLDASVLPQNREEFTHSRDSTDFDAFAYPQLILKQSWQESKSRFEARLVEDCKALGVLCTQSYVTVHAPSGQSDFLDAACLSFNSILAVYYLLLTSSRFASYRPEPLVDELLRVPVPEPRPGLLDDISSYDDIDRRVREAFRFKDAEWVLVEDLFNVTLPDFKGDASSPGRQPTLRQEDSETEPQLRRYCEYFIRVLKAGFGPDKGISATIFHETDGRLPYRLVAFELGRASRTGIRVERLTEPELLAELERVNQTWLHNRKTARGSVYHQRVARVYDHSGDSPTIFLIKPDAYRYWTRSMGLHDADEVAADFVRWQTAMEKVKS